MINSLYIVRKLDAPFGSPVEEVHKNILEYARYKPVFVAETLDQCNKDTLFIAIGGDGTVIHAAKLALRFGAPVIGFNLGKVGFLADFPPDDVDLTLARALAGKMVVDERMVLEYTMGGKTHLALNDFVISCMYSDTTLKYDLSVRNSSAGQHIANGVIVSTPTGSTAYALSVGGSIMEPSADVAQVVPIAPQTLASRPLIINADGGVEFFFGTTKDRPVTIRADGQVVEKYDPQMSGVHYTSVLIKAHPKRVRLLHDKEWNYFDVLSKKLNWNR